MHELVLPNDTNVLGNILGGKVMHYMDICAAMSAYKHARSPVVTASVDQLNFLAPAKVGDILILKSSSKTLNDWQNANTNNFVLAVRQENSALLNKTKQDASQLKIQFDSKRY